MIRSRILLVVSLFAMISCTSMNFVGPAPVRKERIGQKSKVALVGFHPYRSILVGEKINGWLTATCNIELANQYGKKFNAAYFKGRRNVVSKHVMVVPKFDQVLGGISWGEPIRNFPASGLDTDAPQERIKEFINFYYNKSEAGAIPDLCEVLDWDPKSNSFQLRKRNVDYYAVGIFDPRFRYYTLLGAILTVPTSMISLFTLGTLPAIQEMKTVSTFRIYDAKLNLIKEVVTDNSFWTMDAWWVFPSPRSRAIEKFTYDAPVWERDVETLENSWNPE
ncbi:hypothetical protein LEP1GSC050_1822 [Leptospira broomii serovar Hurstbridge str. 5399]|uniref:Lipoprotein n=1 Tax=Leptospira broomii serovar Hurstbridge str. 5399 TaxID=1049789 RepID=T0F864_9LEPT|nr:hypothetical protein [Leptospira broomii]EQA47335.1 hypothetical protein LEP1GSC050_1822 [Leptospira broomii serovar Hurstbridge str. 5399]